MSSDDRKPDANQLIAGLPSREARRVLQYCEPVELLFGMILCQEAEPLESAYFPVTGLISLMATTADQQPLGLAMIGREGVLGATLALGISTPRLRGVVHSPGTGLRIDAARLRGLLRDNPALQSAFKRYIYVLMGQLLQTATCNSFHEVEMRLARWLLMTDDRSSLGRLPLTHQFLADTLGVQRSAVTIAAGKLQRKTLISYSRGHIRILSRAGLEDACCACYREQLRDHARQFSALRGLPTAN